MIIWVIFKSRAQYSAIGGFKLKTLEKDQRWQWNQGGQRNFPRAPAESVSHYKRDEKFNSPEDYGR